MQKGGKKKPLRKAQAQRRPGLESKMQPIPVAVTNNPGSGKLHNKVALITGGDSGIGRAVAVLFAKEGADIAIAYLSEHSDAEETKQMVEEHGKTCILLPGDLSKENNCEKAVSKTVKKFGRIDILVNNAAIHYEAEKLEDISTEQFLKTFSSNIFSYFWVTGGTSSYSGRWLYREHFFGNSLSREWRTDRLCVNQRSDCEFHAQPRGKPGQEKDQGKRCSPGPIWTPLIASSFKPKKVSAFGSDAPMERAGQPAEIAPSYLFLASEDSSYITGQFLHPNGGEIVNG